MAAVKDILGLEAQADTDNIDYDRMAGYNREIDPIREREFPMLQGCCARYVPQELPADRDVRYDLLGPRRYHPIFQVFYGRILQRHDGKPPRQPALFFRVLPADLSANRGHTAQGATIFQGRSRAFRLGLRGQRYRGDQAGHGLF